MTFNSRSTVSNAAKFTHIIEQHSLHRHTKFHDNPTHTATLMDGDLSTNNHTSMSQWQSMDYVLTHSRFRYHLQTYLVAFETIVQLKCFPENFSTLFFSSFCPFYIRINLETLTFSSSSRCNFMSGLVHIPK